MVNRFDIGLKESWTFFFLVIFYFVLLVIRSLNFGPEIIRHHATDLIFIPILMTSVKIVFWLFNFSLEIDKKKIALAVVYSAVAFEWVLPKAGTKFVSDPLDVLAYAIGGFCYFYLIQAQPKKSVSVAIAQNQ